MRPTLFEFAGGEPAFLHAGNGDMSDLGRRFVRCFDLAADDAELPAAMPRWGWDGLDG